MPVRGVVIEAEKGPLLLPIPERSWKLGVFLFV
jgi:hypothetical protein